MFVHKRITIKDDEYDHLFDSSNNFPMYKHIKTLRSIF